tara:strand:- start:691 stop:1002 length:312 start_codon:yes stop_codon:yes gene_type:complete
MDTVNGKTHSERLVSKNKIFSCDAATAKKLISMIKDNEGDQADIFISEPGEYLTPYRISAIYAPQIEDEHGVILKPCSVINKRSVPVVKMTLLENCKINISFI